MYIDVYLPSFYQKASLSTQKASDENGVCSYSKWGKLEKMMSFSVMAGKVQLESLEIVQQEKDHCFVTNPHPLYIQLLF